MESEKQWIISETTLMLDRLVEYPWIQSRYRKTWLSCCGSETHCSLLPDIVSSDAHYQTVIYNARLFTSLCYKSVYIIPSACHLVEAKPYMDRAFTIHLCYSASRLYTSQSFVTTIVTEANLPGLSEVINFAAVSQAQNSSAWV